MHIPMNMPHVWKSGFSKSSTSPDAPTLFIESSIFEVSEQPVPATSAPRKTAALVDKDAELEPVMLETAAGGDALVA